MEKNFIPKTKIVVYFWGRTKEMIEAIEYDTETEYEYSDEKLAEMVRHVLSKGYHIQTRSSGDTLILCIDDRNFSHR